MRSYTRIVHPVGSNGPQQLTVQVLTPADCAQYRAGCTPCFSVTAELMGGRTFGRLESCGAMHETILKYYPKLADVVALHLSDAQGAPMHARENAWYWAEGANAGLWGSRYHGSNSGSHTPEQCGEILKKHLRIDHDTYVWLMVGMRAQDSAKDARAFLNAHIDTLEPRWLTEAQNISEKYQTISVDG